MSIENKLLVTFGSASQRFFVSLTQKGCLLSGFKLLVQESYLHSFEAVFLNFVAWLSKFAKAQSCP